MEKDKKNAVYKQTHQEENARANDLNGAAWNCPLITLNLHS